MPRPRNYRHRGVWRKPARAPGHSVRAKQRKCARRAVRRRVRLLGHIGTAPGAVLMPRTCVRCRTRLWGRDLPSDCIEIAVEPPIKRDLWQMRSRRDQGFLTMQSKLVARYLGVRVAPSTYP